MHPAQQLAAMCQAHLDAVDRQIRWNELQRIVEELRNNYPRDWDDYAIAVARTIDNMIPERNQL